MRAWLHNYSQMKSIRNPKLMNLSTLLHFGAEASIIPAVVVPFIKNWGDRINLEESLFCYGGAIALNIICQPIAFYTKARAMTSEGNWELTTQFAYDYKKNKEKKRNLAAWFDRKLVNLHLYFAKKYGEEK